MRHNLNVNNKSIIEAHCPPLAERSCTSESTPERLHAHRPELPESPAPAPGPGRRAPAPAPPGGAPPAAPPGARETPPAPPGPARTGATRAGVPIRASTRARKRRQTTSVTKLGVIAEKKCLVAVSETCLQPVHSRRPQM